MSDLLVDTNVLVYAYDRSEPVKQRQSLDLLNALANDPGYLTTQVLAEFLVIVTRKIASRLSIADAARRVSNYVATWTILPVTSAIVVEACRGVQVCGLSYWDAQLWACARAEGLKVILSEDFADGTAIEGVSFANPFRAGFKIEDWL